MSPTLSRWAPTMLSVLRIMTALLFIQHGSQKLFGFPPTDQMPPVMSFMWIGGVLEFVGGILVLIGLFTRPVSFILSGMMAVAYFMFHAPGNFYPALNGGDAAILFCFVFLYFVFSGPGPLSVDAKRSSAA